MIVKAELPKDTVKTLQTYVAEKIEERGFEDESLQERLLLLVEEVGELTNACRKINGMNVDTNRDIENGVGEEIADVINLVFAVGIKLNLDIEKEFIAKNEKVDKRIYKRAKDQ